jgi:hypothetical protein
VQRKTEMRATVVERKDTASVVHDEHRTRAAVNDSRPPGPYLFQVPTRIH